ncbi:hypothetical protein K2173_004703 [Erythroxylum novogranatense]|uniref:BHLH domain-containing protein n=1 Tax=Erythroxylum novogranatense TaxID=1862640 RepID=A0AAV8U871_9ROSI|nr:hypothetical protein K2173_004703 [Erythroxylum novogranatense]
MEGESSYNNPERLLPSDFRGTLNDVSYIAGNDQRMFFPTNNSESHNLAWSLPPCFGCPKTPVSYYEFLAENSTFLETGSPSDALRGISPIGPMPDVKGVSDCQRELLSNSLWNPSGFKTSDCFCDMDAYALKPHVHMLNCDIAEASVNVRCSIPHNEGEPESNRLSSQHEIQTHSSRMHHLSKDIGNLPQAHPSVTAAPSAYISNPSKYKAFKRDRERRIRIAEGLRALKGLLPHPVEGGQAAVLNNIIDYIKYLQCEMKCGWDRLLGNRWMCFACRVMEDLVFHYCSMEVM